MGLLLTLVPLAMYWLGQRTAVAAVPDLGSTQTPTLSNTAPPEGAERLDHSRMFASIQGGLMVYMVLYKAVVLPLQQGKGFDWSFSFINPNFLIFLLFGLAILLHGNLHRFQQAVSQGIGGTTGILIQFPLYAGIIGIMIQSGLVNVLSNAFVAISNPTTFPLFTFVSAGVVNVFVPSGGGQWMVQGPVLIEASQALGVPIERSVLALCYGDQVTNMLQPFWALPLLGITGLQAKEILPYTLFLLLVGMLIFCSVLLFV